MVEQLGVAAETACDKVWNRNESGGRERARDGHHALVPGAGNEGDEHLGPGAQHASARAGGI